MNHKQTKLREQPFKQKLEEVINPFIKKWIPESYAHLVDSDDNDGERLRNAILNLVSEEVRKADKKYRRKGFYSNLGLTEFILSELGATEE